MQDSLKRLQLEYIDVLQLHRFDPETPIEESMQALHDVVQKGWVRYVGMSSCWAWQFQLMQSKFIQPPYDKADAQPMLSRTVLLHSFRCRINIMLFTEKRRGK